LHIFSIFVLRAEIVTIFRSKMVTISARIKAYKHIENMQTWQGYIFCFLQRLGKLSAAQSLRLGPEK
jgi:hypothetical protein